MAMPSLLCYPAQPRPGSGVTAPRAPGQVYPTPQCTLGVWQCPRDVSVRGTPRQPLPCGLAAPARPGTHASVHVPRAGGEMLGSRWHGLLTPGKGKQAGGEGLLGPAGGVQAHLLHLMDNSRGSLPSTAAATPTPHRPPGGSLKPAEGSAPRNGHPGGQDPQPALHGGGGPSTATPGSVMVGTDKALTPKCHILETCPGGDQPHQ